MEITAITDYKSLISNTTTITWVVHTRDFILFFLPLVLSSFSRLPLSSHPLSAALTTSPRRSRSLPAAATGSSFSSHLLPHDNIERRTSHLLPSSSGSVLSGAYLDGGTGLTGHTGGEDGVGLTIEAAHAWSPVRVEPWRRRGRAAVHGPHSNGAERAEKSGVQANRR